MIQDMTAMDDQEFAYHSLSFKKRHHELRIHLLNLFITN